MSGGDNDLDAEGDLAGMWDELTVLQERGEITVSGLSVDHALQFKGF